MSTEVGLKTQYLNWRESLVPDLGIDPDWIVVNWWKEHGVIERLPVMPAMAKAWLRSRVELRQGLKNGPFDALYIANLKIMRGDRRTLSAQPYFATGDATMTLLQGFGNTYGIRRSPVPLYEWQRHRLLGEGYRGAIALFPWSSWAAASLVHDYGVDSGRIHVIPPGVDLDRWCVPNRDPGKQRRDILFVGGDFYRKGGDVVLDWAQRTSARDWMLHLVTREPVASPSPRVRVYNDLGPNDPRLVELYRNADVFVLPTRADCYSLAGIEAMASGIPVVLSRTGGTADIIRDGETGFLVSPGDLADLTDRLEYLLANAQVRQQIALAARADVERRYDMRANVAAIVKIMRTCLGHVGTE